MPLPIPNLDDRDYNQLTAEALALIPRNLPQWTDYNPSDPGVTLLELFAFLVEAAIYQINRVPDRSLLRFAALVGVTPLAGETVTQTLVRAQIAAATRTSAVTQNEFEYYALQVTGVARAKALVYVEPDDGTVYPPYQVIQVIVVPTTAPKPPGVKLRQTVYQSLRVRCLISTDLKVLGPRYTPISVTATVVEDSTSRLNTSVIQQTVTNALITFLDPLVGGLDGQGWPFGRSVFRSELYRLIQTVTGVDHVSELLLNGDGLIGEVPLRSPDSLVTIKKGALNVTVVGQ